VSGTTTHRLLDAGRGAALAAVLLYALNLRGPITALAPVVEDVRADLALTATTVGLLTGVPVLCFALITPLAAVLVGRLGTAQAVAGSLLTVLAGTVLRSVGDFPTALVGTVLIGAAITVGNVALPVVVARDFSSGVTGVTGAYTAAMNAGSVLTTLGTAPLAALVGWRWALASWGVLAVVALVAWARVYGWRRAPRVVSAPDAEAAADDAQDDTAHAPGSTAGPGPATPPATVATHVLRNPLTWLFVVTFAAQSASYYGLTAWLPTLLHDQTGLSRAGAGAAAALFQGFGVLGSVLAGGALARWRTRRVALVVGGLWLSLPAGLLLAPAGWAVWASFGGMAQAANFVMIFSVVTVVADSPAAAGRMSAAIQTVGYVAAGLAPSVLGAVHTASGGWRAPLLVVLSALAVMVVVHLAAIGLALRQRGGTLARRTPASDPAPAAD